MPRGCIASKGKRCPAHGCTHGLALCSRVMMLAELAPDGFFFYYSAPPFPFLATRAARELLCSCSVAYVLIFVLQRQGQQWRLAKGIYLLHIHTERKSENRNKCIVHLFPFISEKTDIQTSESFQRQFLSIGSFTGPACLHRLSTTRI